MKHILYKKTLVFAVVFSLSFLVFTPNIFGVIENNNNENININVTTNGNKIELNYKINNFVETPIEIDQTNYYRISFDHEPNILLSGAPDIPNICRSIIIPDTLEMNVAVTSSSFVEYENVLIAPSKGNLLRTVNPDDVAYEFGNEYNVDGFYPGKIVELNEPYILRDFRGQVVKIYPIQYNPVKKTMRFYNDISVEVYPVGQDTRNIINRDGLPTRVETNFNQIYKQHFINYGTLDRYTPIEEQGNMLIITYDAFWDAMIPFYNWKTLKGVPTEMVNVSGVGDANAIKEYIKNYYETKGLAFVVLVGDAAQLPPYYAGGSASDPSNTYIVGNDHYSDCLIGRFSAENVDQLNTQVQRSVEYEQNPQVGADWYKKGIGIGSDQGPGDDNEYDYQHIRNIRTELLGFTYNAVDELYDGSQGGEDAPGNPSPTMVSASVNNGRTLINYCGHGSPTSWGTSGYSNSDIATLVNDNMLPFVISVACNNGEFDSYTCFAEAWVRATHNGEPTGAIGAFMSTISQGWNPPMEAQDEFNLILTGAYADNIKTTLGGLTANGCSSMIDAYGSSGYGESDYWTLFGDPSLQIRTDTPTEMTVDHDALISVGAETFEVDVVGVKNALCAVSAENKLLGYGYTDENGVAVINFFEPVEFMEGAQLAVTAFNKIPYITSVQIGDSYPPEIPEITGPSSGRINKEYEFTAQSTDPEGSQVYYMFSWGDGTQSEWAGPVASGTQVTVAHTWTEKGNFSVKAKAKDTNDSSSRWSNPIYVVVDIPNLKFRVVHGGPFKITASIKNEGIAEANDVDWQINISEGSIFSGRFSKGTIDAIAPGQSVTINSKVILGFGDIQTTITANGPECCTEISRGGKVFLFYVKLNAGGG